MKKQKNNTCRVQEQIPFLWKNFQLKVKSSSIYNLKPLL